MKIAGLRRLEETVVRVPSQGDNWHMSWANDDRQYVSLCDGSGFPGSPTRRLQQPRMLSPIAGRPARGRALRLPAGLPRAADRARHARRQPLLQLRHPGARRLDLPVPQHAQPPVRRAGRRASSASS